MTTSTPTVADALITALHEPGRENLLDLVRNPLRLTLLCMTWDGSSLPDTQADLYARYLKEVYQWNQNVQEWRDHAGRCGTTITQLKQALNQQLGELAQAALALPQERFRLSQVLVEEYLGEELDETSLGYLALRLGWLNRVGRDHRGDSIFAFYHATFQEYFAALAVADWDYFLPRDHVNAPVAGKRYRIFEPQWKQVILLWLGRKDVGNEEKRGFINKLVSFETGCDQNGNFYYYPAYFLAAEGISQYFDFESLISISDLNFSLADTIIQQLIAWAFGSFNQNRKKWTNSLKPIEIAAKAALKSTKWDKVIVHLTQQIEIMLIAPHAESFIGDAFETEREELGLDSQTFNALISLVQYLQSNAESRTTLISELVFFLGEIAQGNLAVIVTLVEILRDAGVDRSTRRLAAFNLEKIAPGNEQVIAALEEILRDAGTDCFTRGLAAQTLGQIAPGNEEAIAVLEEILRDAGADIGTRRLAAEGLRQIAPGNEEAIAALVEIFRDAGAYYSYRRDAAENLANIAPGNEQAINAFVETLQDAGAGVGIHCLAACTLGKIAPGSEQAITALVEISRDAGADIETRRLAACTLGKIALGNEQAITALVGILRDAGADKNTRREAAWSLEKIALGNEQAIAALEEILRDAGADDSTRWHAARSLGIIAPGNEQAITVLEEILRDAGADDSTRWQAARSLGIIAPGNEQAIAALEEILRDAGAYYSYRSESAWSLGIIAPGNEQAINALVEILRDADAARSTRWYAAKSLGKIAPGNEQAIAALEEILRDAGANDSHCRDAAESLGKILTTRKHYAGVVSALKDCLSNEIHQRNFDQFNECYKLIWNCAENLPYPEFYQAWHNPPITPHPEIENTTPTASTPFTQKYNLALLPQSIAQAIKTANHPPHRRVICIDGSRFSDPKNPALQLYTALKKADCPPSPDGKPRTISELQAYCEDDLSETQIALILYEAPTDPPPQGFDLDVLNQLARFSHPPIAVVVPQSLADCPLPQFLATDANLIANLLQWLHNLEG
ncbi:HEAT repeat domain-containing protein [Spirulina subsalsa CS-330]|uniref:HEAT repeat domain-containing protein n=1 Tax=Spirulina TaxID=1154 RepID=UPI00232AE41D|nr:HEAT repeat domain-containing protein [Spirulina subsalsa]MDB9494969.1 HEAT repeat domain-containing protein [Spirulina subsalsa CS-330]